MTRVAILVSCYNRREITKRCMDSLALQIHKVPGYSFDIWVCDDHSTDGTVRELRENYPYVNVIETEGNFYWCKSMHLLMEKTVTREYDYYLMINDDVEFYEDMLETMIKAKEGRPSGDGIVGTTVSRRDGNEYTYGGRTRDFDLIFPNGHLQTCEWANWNCFFIDKKTVEQVGIIDGYYSHGQGDFDYSARMRKKNLNIWVAPKAVGECECNTVKNTYTDSSLSRMDRYKKLFSPKGMPFVSYMHFHIRCFGGRGIFKYLYGYLSILVYIALKKDI